jgi:hypothetical protein
VDHSIHRCGWLNTQIEGYNGQSLVSYINPSLVAPGGSSATSTETQGTGFRNAVLHRDGGRDPFAFNDLYCEVHHFIRFSRSDVSTLRYAGLALLMMLLVLRTCNDGQTVAGR